MFKVRGATVYPSEVERALHAIADVRRAFVVDVAGDDSAAVAAAVGVLVDGSSYTVDDLARTRRSAERVQSADAVARHRDRRRAR